MAGDLVAPLSLLLFFFAYRRTFGGVPGRRHVLWCALAGLTLAVAELSWPYFLFVLPLVLGPAALRLRRQGAAPLAAFLIPFLLVSGGWHLKLLAMESPQLLWSNHVGCDMMRSWQDWAFERTDPGERPRTAIQRPRLEPEGPPYRMGRPSNLDTAVHFRNCQRVRSAVLDAWAAQPRLAAARALENVAGFWRVRFDFMGRKPASMHPGLLAYAGLVWLCAAMLLLNGAVVGWMLVRHGRRRLLEWPEVQLVAVTVFAGALYPVATSPEEFTRFMVVLLPLLAVLPTRPLRFAVKAGAR